MGSSLEKFISDNWMPYMHPDDLEQTIRTVGEAIQERKLYRMEHRLLRHDGEYRWLLTQGAPSYYASGELYGYVGSSIDITEIRTAEQKLQRYALELAAANEDISASKNKLEKSNAYLSRVNSDLDNFIYTASHDLKAPINNRPAAK